MKAQLLIVAAAASMAVAQPASAFDKKARQVSGNAFSAKLELGPSYHVLYEHPLPTFEATLALGGQFKRHGALHGSFGFAAGTTDEGLAT